MSPNKKADGGRGGAEGEDLSQHFVQKEAFQDEVLSLYSRK